MVKTHILVGGKTHTHTHTHTHTNDLHRDNVRSSSIGKGDPVWYVHAVVTVGSQERVRMGQSKST